MSAEIKDLLNKLGNQLEIVYISFEKFLELRFVKDSEYFKECIPYMKTLIEEQNVISTELVKLWFLYDKDLKHYNKNAASSILQTTSSNAILDSFGVVIEVDSTLQNIHKYLHNQTVLIEHMIHLYNNRTLDAIYYYQGKKILESLLAFEKKIKHNLADIWFEINDEVKNYRMTTTI